jgi:hypothetical protein
VPHPTLLLYHLIQTSPLHPLLNPHHLPHFTIIMSQKAIVQNEVGAPLVATTRPIPTATPGHILVKITSVGRTSPLTLPSSSTNLPSSKPPRPKIPRHRPLHEGRPPRRDPRQRRSRRSNRPRPLRHRLLEDRRSCRRPNEPLRGPRPRRAAAVLPPRLHLRLQDPQ